MELNKAHIGNALTLAEQLRPNSIHTLITSPPYWGLRDYGLDPFDWPAVEYTPMAGLPPVRVEAWRGCLGLEPDPFAFVGHIVAIFRALWRGLRDDGTCWLNFGDSYAASSKGSGGMNSIQPNNVGSFYDAKFSLGALKPKDLCGIPWRVAFALQADGWYLRSDVIWAKPNPMPESVTDRPTKAHEYLFLLSKSERYFYDAEAVREAQDSADPSHPSYRKGFMTPDGVSQAGTKWQMRDGEFGVRQSFKRKFLNPAGRNRRSVWTVATKPYAAAHFATYPPALIEPCILASTSDRCCPTCGAGWVRVVERIGKSTPVEGRKGRVGHNGNNPQQSGYFWDGPTTRATGEFRPACDCPPADPVPAVVLDPFLGSGTTAEVAIRHRRNWIGFEASAEYAELINARLNGVQIRMI